jgi:hypothetical protein
MSNSPEHDTHNFSSKIDLNEYFDAGTILTKKGKVPRQQILFGDDKIKAKLSSCDECAIKMFQYLHASLSFRRLNDMHATCEEHRPSQAEYAKPAFQNVDNRTSSKERADSAGNITSTLSERFPIDEATAE